MKQKRQNATAVGLVNGSMATVTGAARVRNIQRKRHFMVAASSLQSSSQVLSATQSPFPVGSQFTDSTELYAASELSANARAWIQNHDKYRISNVEVFATLVSRSKTGGIDRSLPVEVYFYEDTDADPATLTSWIRTMDRDNLGRVVLHATNPSMRLISFKPTLSFSAGNTSQNPANVVPEKNKWLDALSLDQVYAGLRVFSACPQVDSSGQSYYYSIALSTRFTIEASQPI